MRSFSPSMISLALVAMALSTGCLFVNDSTTNEGSGGSSGGNTTQKDINQYDDLQKSLEKNRTQFLPEGAMELTAIGTRLYWLDFNTFDPHLHSFDNATQKTVDYKFSIGTGDTYNWRASDNLIVTADIAGGDIVYRAFANDGPNTVVGTFTLPQPGEDVKWWSYSPDQGNVYVVMTGDKTQLLSWTAGQKEATEVLALEDLGLQVGEFEDFIVDEGKMIFIEGQRIWSLDLATKKPTWLGNKFDADAAWTGKNGVLYSTAMGPFFFDYGTKKVTDVSHAIEASSFKLNTTFAQSHFYDGAFEPASLTRFNDNVSYTASAGLFNIDLDTDTVKPILLDARDDTVVYTSPVTLSDGTIFVKGLVSNEGDIGADGPVYRVNFSY